MTAVMPGPSAQGISREQHDRFHDRWDAPRGRLTLLREINNIPIARRYMITGFAFFLAGGVLALLMRIQLGSPENTFLDAETYNQLFTMHGTTMMFLFVIPFIEAIANYMMPLLLGTRDLPFPRMTALSYWTYLFGGILLYSSFLFGVAPDGGWFAYPPLTNRTFSPGVNMDFWDIGLSVAEVAAMGAAAELIIAILRTRAPGMSLSRLPLFAWAMLITGFMIIFGFTPLIVGTAMLELDRKGLTAFFIPTAGGEPLLWQHLFWVFGHPEVYIMFIPAVGIVSQVVQTFSRRPIVSYVLMVLAIIATGFLSFGLWVHHMFATGLPLVAMGFFSAASLMIAIPNGVQMFGWIATLWSGRPIWRTPLLFVLGFIVIFVLGGVTGVMVGSVPFDWQVHDSYFVVAHFHYVLIGGVVFPLFAGLYYWLPKITGRMLSERLGRWNAALMFIFFNVAFFPMHISGLLGMPRRVYTYPAGAGLETTNLISTIGAFGFALAIALFIVNVIWSRKHGAPAGANPWGADTLEWAETSPPPNAQFQFIPVVRSRHPLWDQERFDARTPEEAELLAPMASAPTRFRGTLLVSTVHARPIAVAHVPGPTIFPFIMSVGFLLLFAGAIVEVGWLIAAGLLATAVALVGWFWPMETERVAMTEIGTEPRAGVLPLAVSGPLANGYWGTGVLCLILLTALASVISSYYYLGEGPDTWPPTRPDDVGRAIAGAALLVASAGVLWRTRRSLVAERMARRRFSLGAVAVLALAGGWLMVDLYRRGGFDPATDAYASAVLLVLGFVWAVLVLMLVMTGVSLAWALRSPRDPRGYAVVHNAGLVGGVVALSAVAALFVLYLGPRLF